MSGLIAHRGPDAEGFLVDGPVGLANRRLAIIDLSAGRAPADVATRTARSWIVYNGELYNFRELRARAGGARPPLPLRAPTPRSSSTPTRSGARLRATASTACSPSRSGTAARGASSLARDRFGVKPLYYAWIDGALLFGSEIKALLAAGFPAPASTPRRCVEYFTFQNVFSDRTLFEGVRAAARRARR